MDLLFNYPLVYIRSAMHTEESAPRPEENLIRKGPRYYYFCFCWYTFFSEPGLHDILWNYIHMFGIFLISYTSCHPELVVFKYICIEQNRPGVDFNGLHEAIHIHRVDVNPRLNKNGGIILTIVTTYHISWKWLESGCIMMHMSFITSSVPKYKSF